MKCVLCGVAVCETGHRDVEVFVAKTTVALAV